MFPEDLPRPLRLALLTREHPRSGASGGIGTYTEDLARGLAARGHAVTVIARGGPSNPEPPPAPGQVRLLPIEAAEAWRLPGLGRLAGMTARTAPFALAASRMAESAGPFDLIEVPEYQGWGVVTARRARCPVVVRLHGHTALVRRQNGDPFDLDAAACSALEAATLRQARLLTAASACLAAEARRDFGASLAADRLHVVPLGVDVTHFAPGLETRREGVLGIPPDHPVVLYVGRLETRKGVMVLLEAFLRLRTAHPEAVLVMAGEDPPAGSRPPLRLTVLDRARQAGAATAVRLLGRVPREELPALYARGDVFVAPSLAEPFGLVFLEAMACGRPVVGCRSGAVPEIVQEGHTGWLVPPGDAEALAARLAAALASPGCRARIGAAARTTAVARFSLEALARETERMYRTALEQASATSPAGAARAAA